VRSPFIFRELPAQKRLTKGYVVIFSTYLHCISTREVSGQIAAICESQSLYTVHHRSSQKGLRSLCYTGLTDNNVVTVMHCIPIRKVSRSVCGQLQKSLYKRRLVNFVHLKSVLIRKILNKDIRRYYCGMSIIDF